MKSDLILMLFAISTLVCATYAAPVRSEIQELNDQKKVKELLDLINQAVKSQLAEKESMNVREAFELLKDITKLQQNDDDDHNENALVDNMGEMAREKEDNLSEEAQAQFIWIPPRPGHWFSRD